MRTLRIKNREKALQYYGGNPPQCKNCKYSDVRSLDLDHIKNDGSSHRKALGNYSLYAWLKKNNYPKGFQVLCRNCNWIKYSEKREIERIKREKLKN